jgi:hypothetical protein
MQLNRGVFYSGRMEEKEPMGRTLSRQDNKNILNSKIIIAPQIIITAGGELV